RIRYLLHERGLTIGGARKILAEEKSRGVSYCFGARGAVEGSDELEALVRDIAIPEGNPASGAAGACQKGRKDADPEEVDHEEVGPEVADPEVADPEVADPEDTDAGAADEKELYEEDEALLHPLLLSPRASARGRHTGGEFFADHYSPPDKGAAPDIAQHSLPGLENLTTFPGINKSSGEDAPEADADTAADTPGIMSLFAVTGAAFLTGQAAGTAVADGGNFINAGAASGQSRERPTQAGVKDKDGNRLALKGILAELEEAAALLRGPAGPLRPLENIVTDRGDLS
ncbi:MAG: hypothetical protein LBH65_02995, partial [Desulfovibrio sp.]|nr:hypothetical protein [Desulfovibrio sp.]